MRPPMTKRCKTVGRVSNLPGSICTAEFSWIRPNQHRKLSIPFNIIPCGQVEGRCKLHTIASFVLDELFGYISQLGCRMFERGYLVKRLSPQIPYKIVWLILERLSHRKQLFCILI